MSFTKPSFNLLASVWLCKVPSAGMPDYTDMPVQKFINNKLFQDVTPQTFVGWWTNWSPPVVLRFNRIPPFDGPWSAMSAMTFEVPQGSGQYYRTMWRDIMHEGFTNEYCIVVCVQCDQDGKAIPPPGADHAIGTAPDVCVSPPPPPPPGTLALDSFMDTGSTPLTSHAMNFGAGWTIPTGGGSWDIMPSGVGAQVTSIGTFSLSMAVTDVGTADCQIEVYAVAVTSSIFFGAIARLTDFSNAYFATYDSGSGTFAIAKWVANVSTNIASTTIGTPATAGNYSIFFHLVGTSLSAILSGPGGISGSLLVTDSTWTSQTKMGMIQVLGGTNYFDYFYVH